MTSREEEIKEALGNTFDTELWDYESDSSYCNYRAGFSAGAKWADNHPKSPWISVEEDLPCNHKELLLDNGLMTKEVFVLINATTPRIILMTKFSEWDWVLANVTHWFPIPELPKE